MPSCLVNRCVSKTGRKGQSDQIILHPFPKDLSRIMVWLQQTGQIFQDLDALAQKILDGNKQNKYRLCSCHFTPDSYIINVNHHGKSLKFDAVPTIFPYVGEGECIIEENLKKKRIRKRKRPYDLAADVVSQPWLPPLNASALGRLEVEGGVLQYSGRIDIKEDEEQEFCSIGTQTSTTLNNSLLVCQDIRVAPSDDGSGMSTHDAAVSSSLDMMSKLKHYMDSLLQEVPIRFDDVAVYFSAKEWDSLEMVEKLLYMEVMLDNYYNLCSLGFIYEKPKIISIIEKCQDHYHTADWQPIKVKEEPETDASNGGHWRTESLALNRVLYDEDLPRHDLVDQSFYNDVRIVTVKEESDNCLETDSSNYNWRAKMSVSGQQEPLLRAQMFNGEDLRRVYQSQDQSLNDEVKLIRVKLEPEDFLKDDESARNLRSESPECNKLELQLEAQTFEIKKAEDIIDHSSINATKPFVQTFGNLPVSQARGPLTLTVNHVQVPPHPPILYLHWSPLSQQPS